MEVILMMLTFTIGFLATAIFFFNVGVRVGSGKMLSKVSKDLEAVRNGTYDANNPNVK